MNSVLIEYLRFDNLGVGILTAGKNYILSHKDLPIVQVTTTEDHIELLKKFRKALRYENSGISYEEKWTQIVEISNIIRPLFISLANFKYSNCQLDVVLSASELGLLPFELLLDEKEAPYFANPNRPLIFTRRLRQEYLETSFQWPIVPRVLFIYSHGSSKQVPFNDHLYEIDKSLKKWGGVANGKVFTLLPEANFYEFVSTLQSNDTLDGHFTHIHILAHGSLIFDEEEPENFEYGITFGKTPNEVITADSIKSLFISLNHKPFLVNFMICDGANFLNPIKVDKNPVQVTHKAGVPIVLGSQFPLSMDGSTQITKGLYTPLFEGKDIRAILFNIRYDLYKTRNVYHDWISFTSYIRLPEGYKDFLFRISLRLQMDQLKLIKSQTDSYINKNAILTDEFETSRYDLQHSIKQLESTFNDVIENKAFEDDVLENLGLLGSAYKRLAELHFINEILRSIDIEQSRIDQRAALANALEYYRQASDRNLSHHWSTVQYLSLDVILNNKVPDLAYWYSAMTAANNAIRKNPNDGWAYGSQIELLLLSNKSQGITDAAVIDKGHQLVNISQKIGNKFLLTSTWSQVNRYKTWWIASQGFVICEDILVCNQVLVDEILNLLSVAEKKFVYEPKN